MDSMEACIIAFMHFVAWKFKITEIGGDVIWETVNEFQKVGIHFRDVPMPGSDDAPSPGSSGSSVPRRASKRRSDSGEF